MNVKSNSGFSLVELMVVVAIIGVLATVAVPNYMKFQAKAKQTNAKSELSGVYTAEKAFFIEYTSYSSALPTVGYVPEGVAACKGAKDATYAGPVRLYSVGFATAATAVTNATDPCGLTAVDGVTFFSLTSGSALTPTGSSIATPTTAFTASAEGKIGGSANDIWTINANNLMVNTQSGI